MSDDQKERTGRASKGTKGVVMGAGVGMIFGAAFGKAGIGLVLGAGLGLLVGAVLDREKRNRAD